MSDRWATAAKQRKPPFRDHEILHPPYKTPGEQTGMSIGLGGAIPQDKARPSEFVRASASSIEVNSGEALGWDSIQTREGFTQVPSSSTSGWVTFDRAGHAALSLWGRWNPGATETMPPTRYRVERDHDGNIFTVFETLAVYGRPFQVVDITFPVDKGDRARVVVVRD